MLDRIDEIEKGINQSSFDSELESSGKYEEQKLSLHQSNSILDQLISDSEEKESEEGRVDRKIKIKVSNIEIQSSAHGSSIDGVLSPTTDQFFPRPTLNSPTVMSKFSKNQVDKPQTNKTQSRNIFITKADSSQNESSQLKSEDKSQRERPSSDQKSLAHAAKSKSTKDQQAVALMIEKIIIEEIGVQNNVKIPIEKAKGIARQISSQIATQIQSINQSSGTTEQQIKTLNSKLIAENQTLKLKIKQVLEERPSTNQSSNESPVKYKMNDVETGFIGQQNPKKTTITVKPSYLSMDRSLVEAQVVSPSRGDERAAIVGKSQLKQSNSSGQIKTRSISESITLQLKSSALKNQAKHATSDLNLPFQTLTIHQAKRQSLVIDSEQSSRAGSAHSQRSQMRNFFRKRIIPETIHPSDAIIGKIMESQKAQANLIANCITLKQLSKIINQSFANFKSLKKKTVVYDDGSVHSFVRIGENLFDNIVKKYGMPKIANKKFKRVIGGILKFMKEVVRVRVFAKFMGLREDKYDELDFDLYSKFTAAMNNHQLGITMPMAETDEKLYVPFFRLQEFVRVYFQESLKANELTQMKKEIETFKEKCTKGNTKGKIQFDPAFECLAKWNRSIIQRSKDNVVDLFNSIDFSKSGKIEILQFTQLIKVFEPEKYDFDLINNLFSEYQITEETDVNGVTSIRSYLVNDQFTSLCVKYSLFSSDRQNQVLGLTSRQADVKHLFNSIKSGIEGKIDRIQSRFLVDQRSLVKYSSTCKNAVQLQESFNDVSEEMTNNQMRQLCLSYIVLDKISIYAYLEHQVGLFLPRGLKALESINKSEGQREFEKLY